MQVFTLNKILCSQLQKSAEVNDFFSQCYVPARSKYQAQRPDMPAITAILGTYGADDPDWMGSHVYCDTAGYYDTLRPTSPIIGWTYNAARDTEYDPTSPPAWGKPYCKQWWEDGAIGLRDKHDAKHMLLNMITTSLYLGLPLLWSGMMAWAGVKVGRSLEAATSPHRSPAQDAGRQGASIGKTMLSKGTYR